MKYAIFIAIGVSLDPVSYQQPQNYRKIHRRTYKNRSIKLNNEEPQQEIKEPQDLKAITDLNKEILTEDGVDGVHGDLVLRGITNEPLSVGEGDIGRCGAVPLVIGDDLNAIVLPDADARVRGPKINADSWSFTFASHCREEVGDRELREMRREREARIPPLGFERERRGRRTTSLYREKLGFLEASETVDHRTI